VNKNIHEMKKMMVGIFAVVLILVAFEACQPASGNSPGHEYMPDMAHSIGQEANVYNEYSLHTWDKESTKSLKELSQPRNPVYGSVARGYVGLSNTNDFVEMQAELNGSNRSVRTPVNGHVNYYYADTEEERTRANKEIIGNPYPITKAGLAKGKELYNIYCGICHGEKGGGNGYLVAEENKNAKYPAQPANFLQDTFYKSNNGRFYHAIVYGKNVMGGYTDKMSFEERWDVIHYIRSLQANDKKLEYNDKHNTLNLAWGAPDSLVQAMAAAKKAGIPAAAPAKVKAAVTPAATPAATGGAGHSMRK
jgi:mono/diheme cytochrome c family protein